MSRRLALITGASAGIGAAFARVYAEAGCDVAITARRRDRLETLAAEIRKAHGVEVYCVSCDLAAPGAVDALLAEIKGHGREVDILVNNAGYGLPGGWSDTRWEDQAYFLQLMLTAPLELSHKVLGGMAQRGWGRILNIASLAGYAPVSSGHTLYGAVKAALIRFSQSVNIEMGAKGVHVTAVCPGFTLSEFHDVNGTRDAVNRLPRYLWQSAEQVARIGRKANEANRAVVVTGVPNKLIAGLSKVMPDDVGLMLGKSATWRQAGAKKT
jgi:short-subunit dehydrogenase